MVWESCSFRKETLENIMTVLPKIKDERGNLKAEYTIEGMHIYADGYMQVLRALMPHLKAVAERLAKA